MLGEILGEDVEVELMAGLAEEKKGLRITMLEYFVNNFERKVCPSTLARHGYRRLVFLSFQN